MMAMSSGKPIVPCRLDDSDPPALLADIKYADFRNDFAVGMTAVLGAVGIAEEISASRTAAELAETVGASLSANQRRGCYKTFIENESIIDGKVMAVTSGRVLEMLALFGNAPRDLELLKKSGLIEEFKEVRPSFKASFAATPMARRVFALWAAEA
jgi:hypothetical protein